MSQLEKVQCVQNLRLHCKTKVLYLHAFKCFIFNSSPLFSSYYLYTYDKMVAPNVSLRREAEMSPDVFGALLKHHYSRRMLGHEEPPMGQ